MKKRYHIISKLLLLSAFIVAGVGISYNTPLATQSQVHTQSGAGPLDSPLIDGSNVLGAPLTPGDPPQKPAEQSVDQIYNHFALLGTVVGNKDFALAIIEDKALGTQKLYKVGQYLYGGVITDILRERVIIRLHGKDLVFKMGGGSHSGNQDVKPKADEERRLVTVSLESVQEAFEALSQPMTKVRLARRSPNIETGNGGGLQLSDVEPGSVFEEMGLRDGDVIEEINGNPIKDPYNAVAVYNLMKSVLPGDILSESGLDLGSFLNGGYNQTAMLQRMGKLFYLFGKSKNTQLTLTVKQGGRRR
ncbi:MAG: PDZ domain-containing protein [Desulfobacteraceae bacterium]|jgi:general secretion pathway protein C